MRSLLKNGRDIERWNLMNVADTVSISALFAAGRAWPYFHKSPVRHREPDIHGGIDLVLTVCIEHACSEKRVGVVMEHLAFLKVNPSRTPSVVLHTFLIVGEVCR